MIEFSSKRNKCPVCGSSDGKADIIKVDGKIVENEGFFKCHSCGHFESPYAQKTKTLENRTIDITIVEALDNPLDAFQQFCADKFPKNFQAVKNEMKIGADKQKNTVFFYSSNEGIKNCKIIHYGADLKRLKKGASPIVDKDGNSQDAKFAYCSNADNKSYRYFEKNDSVVFGGTRLFSFNYEKIIIVESEKSAFIAQCFFGFGKYAFIAVGGSNGITPNKMKWLRSLGVPICVLFDNDDAGLKAAFQSANDYEINNLTVQFASFCKTQGYEKGTDIADVILQDWKFDLDEYFALAPKPIGDNGNSIIHKVLNWFEGNKIKFRYVDVSQEYEYSMNNSEYMPITDRLVNKWWRDINMAGIKASIRMIEALIQNDDTVIYSPFQIYIDSLPKYTPTKYDNPLMELSELVSVPDDPTDPNTNPLLLWKIFLKRWLIGFYLQALGKATNPYVLIFSGAQGIGKSQFARRLLPPELERYFKGAASVSNIDKDTKIESCSKYLIELDEIDYISKNEQSSLKSLFSTDSFYMRKPYGHIAENMKRYASYIGSTNELTVLSDTTGNRRYLIVEAFDIKFKEITPKLMNRVFSQIKYLADTKGETGYLTPHEELLASRYIERFRAKPYIEIALERWLKRAPQHRDGLQIQEIFYRLCEVDPKIKTYENKNLGSILKNLGYTNRVVRVGETTKRLYDCQFKASFENIHFDRAEYEFN